MGLGLSGISPDHYVHQEIILCENISKVLFSILEHMSMQNGDCSSYMYSCVVNV